MIKTGTRLKPWVQLKCLYCQTIKEFRPSSIPKSKRFCSKKCWYSWNTGSNNRLQKQIEVECNFCRHKFKKIPSHIGEFNYCSRKCSDIDSREKRKGENNRMWRGGVRLRRGSNWGTIRKEVLEKCDYLCAHCGMTEEAHKLKYKRSFDVHHKITPFRLDFDNSPENLEALCLKCHGKAEKELRKTLSNEQLQVMRSNLSKVIAHEDDHSRVYNVCDCGNRKAKKAKTCRPCLTKKRQQNLLPNNFCLSCKKRKSNRYAKICQSCYIPILSERNKLRKIANVEVIRKLF